MNLLTVKLLMLVQKQLIGRYYEKASIYVVCPVNSFVKGKNFEIRSYSLPGRLHYEKYIN
jgi:hypothetical protein